MKKLLEKNLIIIVFILIEIVTAIMTFNNVITPGDTPWNFGNIYKYYSGYTLYTDINYLLPPMFILIGNILFKILGANFATFAVYNCLIIGFLFAVIYMLLISLKIDKKVAILAECIMFLIAQSKIIMTGANYNILGIAFYILGVATLVRSIEKNESNIKTNITQAILLFVTFLTNQKLGAGYVISIIAFEIWNYKKRGIINLINIGIMALLELGVFLFILYLKNNLWDFINICVLGISDFKSNIIMDKMLIIEIIISVIGIITSIIIYKKIKDEKIKTNNRVLLTFSLGSMLIIYPILNRYHYELGSILIKVLLVYNIYETLKDIISEEKMQDKILPRSIKLFIGIIIFEIIIYLVCLLGLYPNIEKNKNSIFFGIAIENGVKENIKAVTEYITEKENEGKNVIILSESTMLYSLEIGEEHGYFDVFCQGNFGKNGNQRMINEIKNTDNLIILVNNKERSQYEIYQYVDEIRDFIKENYEFIGELENLDIYEKD